MKTAFASTLALGLLTSLVTAAPAHHNNKKQHSFCWHRTDTVFVFGDSYSSLMGNGGTIDHTWNNFSSNAQIYDNPIIENKTKSGGLDWNQYLTGCHEGLPQKCDPQLWNFAYSGAVIDNDAIDNHEPDSVSFVEQIDRWINKLNPTLKWDPASSLGIFFIGLNDVYYTAPMKNLTADLYDEIQDTYFDKMHEMYKHNLRSFMFFNVPSWTRTPYGLENPDIPNDKWASIYNHKLVERVTKFQKSHHDAHVLYFDTRTHMDYYLDHYDRYGFETITTYCPNNTAADIHTNYADYGCLPMEKYFWFDAYHPTSPVHKLLATDIKETLQRESRC
ncbi:hypothetical protein LRAMOSA11325 [Lichtheimia ramosa]|uniref:SGNH hydrolase-type esterase domain-containing protein n=1 Tax=Lichtheimia ramosa TaxID=688394 RepID=A0A077WU67_9FUNG|nr:hypothetical protein LRAMOSA11325 [Lichtheimia ramosa]